MTDRDDATGPPDPRDGGPADGTGGDPFADTIDWDAYWREGRDADADYPADVAAGKFELLERFFERVGVPDDAAFVGCGPGDLPAAVAASYPGTLVVGYDAAASVLAANRDRHDRPNLAFERAVLPAFDPGRQFDLVYCYATLHYVREAEAAVEALYRHVRPGGHLVCHYPNEATRRTHRDATGALAERFALVRAGANLLSRERVADLLDADVRDYWALVDADGPFVRPENPCVAVSKGQSRGDRSGGSP